MDNYISAIIPVFFLYYLLLQVCYFMIATTKFTKKDSLQQVFVSMSVLIGNNFVLTATILVMNKMDLERSLAKISAEIVYQATHE